jgi:hypothetical protein
MKTKRQFDCVKMKNDIQVKQLEQQHDLPDEEIRRRIRHNLETSQSAVAKLWRQLAVHGSARP